MMRLQQVRRCVLCIYSHCSHILFLHTEPEQPLYDEAGEQYSPVYISLYVFLFSLCLAQGTRKKRCLLSHLHRRTLEQEKMEKMKRSVETHRHTHTHAGTHKSP